MENKILGFLPIFYGVEYLECSLNSIKDHVDKVHVAYTRNPSHSFTTKEKCPDSEQEVFDICSRVLGEKLIWEAVNSYQHEALHRDQRYKHSNGYQIILSIDADEVFEGVPEALEYMRNHSERYYGISGYINFWRNFNWCNRDGFKPIRGERLDVNNHAQNLDCPMTVYHFSTCQRKEVMQFKNKIFGHAPEIRPNWFEKVYLAWSPETNLPNYLHPVSFDVWGAAEPFDKTILPVCLKNHSNFNKEFI